MGKIAIGNKVFEISFIDSAFLKIFALNGLLDAFKKSLAKTKNQQDSTQKRKITLIIKDASAESSTSANQKKIPQNFR